MWPLLHFSNAARMLMISLLTSINDFSKVVRFIIVSRGLHEITWDIGAISRR